MKIQEKILKNGETIILDNSEFCETNQIDDFISAECSFRNEIKNTWANGFEIDFNGRLF